MKLSFSLLEETALIEDFVRGRSSAPWLEEEWRKGLMRFCRQYRTMNREISFLNESFSTRWLVRWREDYFARGRCSGTLSIALGRARQWTRRLFSRGILDDDAFSYIDILPFVQGEQDPHHLSLNLQRHIWIYGKKLAQRYRPWSVRVYCGVFHDFNKFQNAKCSDSDGWERLENESLILAWIQDMGTRIDERNGGTRLRVIRDFLEFLRSQELLRINPAERLYERYPRRGWRGLARIGHAQGSIEALEALLPPTRFAGPWGLQMLEFIQLKRGLGAGYDFEERTLGQLDRYIAQAGVPHQGIVSPSLIHGWLQSLTGNSAMTRHTKRRVAEMFFDYLISLELLSVNPARSRSREPRRTKRPFVFTNRQVQEILERATHLRDLPFFPHRGAIFVMIFATLYCLGLRINEACRLSLEDLDLVQGVLLIRESKFYKSRLLPLGPRYCAQLAEFVNLRRALPYDSREDAPLFVSRNGKRIRRRLVGSVFRRIAKEMNLIPQPGQRAPCLHSFRHSFALNRLLRWYREGNNVQAKLPLLSAFMGHADINSTQVYLQETQDLLDEANARFEANFGIIFPMKGDAFRDKE